MDRLSDIERLDNPQWPSQQGSKLTDGQSKFKRNTLNDVYNHSTWIQIKICAEYREVLPRPRLVCQGPGLISIGRSPDVPDKSSRGLGNMSRFSAQILICFIHFHFSVGLVGNFAGLPSRTVPSATVHCNQNEAAHETIKAPSMPCWGATCSWKHSLAFMPQGWWNWQIKWVKSVSIGSYQYTNEWRVFLHTYE